MCFPYVMLWQRRYKITVILEYGSGYGCPPGPVSQQPINYYCHPRRWWNCYFCHKSGACTEWCLCQCPKWVFKGLHPRILLPLIRWKLCMHVKLKWWHEGYQTIQGNIGEVGASVGLVRLLVVVVGWMLWKCLINLWFWLHYFVLIMGITPISWILSAFLGYPRSVDIIRNSWIYPHFVYIIRIYWILWIHPNFVDIICIGHITS